MITIKNLRTLSGTVESEYQIESQEDQVIDAKGKLTLLPALIDPHVHFRTPGHEEKEDWITGARAAIKGGVTTLFDMPNNNPMCVTLNALKEKKAEIDRQLEQAKIPLRYGLYMGASKEHLHELEKVTKEDVVGIKVFLGSSTGDLLIDEDETLREIFRIASQKNLLIAFHAEEESLLEKVSPNDSPEMHSKRRDRTAAIEATKRIIDFTRSYPCPVYLLHVTTKEEVQLIREAKKEGLLIYAEVTPHHLFLTEKDYAELGNKAVVNPPLRTLDDQEALWEGINDNTFDTVGSDHAPHTLQEKEKPYAKAPSGVPGVETTLPLLLHAANEGRLSLEKIVSLTHNGPQEIFNLPRQNDCVLVDLNKEHTIDEKKLSSKCGWSPYAGWTLKGWPEYTILRGKVFPCQ